MAMVRQRGEGGPALWAMGIVLESQACIGVKWAWISLPAVRECGLELGGPRLWRRFWPV